MKLTFSLPGLLFIPSRGSTEPSTQSFRDKTVPFLIKQVKELPSAMQVWLPMDWALHCQALFYRERSGGVAALYYQALAQILKEAHLIAHEKWIQHWDGSRLLIDRENPRVELTLYRSTKETRKPL